MIDKGQGKVMFTRRETLQGAAAGLAGAVLAGGTGLGTLAALATPTPAKAATSFYKGCDVGWLQQMEATGYKFYDVNGVQQDCLNILHSYGMTAVRLRTWVNPSTDPVNGHCSELETAAMALRCQKAGLAVMIDIHYGDTWNSVGHQVPPAAWASYNYSQMLSAVSSYTSNLMHLLHSYGVTPNWVQTGNEINSGLLHPVGSVSIPAQMTGLINAGYDMIKQVFPNTPTIIHLAQPQNGSSITTMLDRFVANGGKWDILGFSSYGGSTVAQSIVNAMAGFSAQFGKPFMQVEFGGPASSPGSTAKALNIYCQGVRNAGGLGFFYWEPEVYAPFASYSAGAWQTNGQPISTIMNAFKSA